MSGIELERARDGAAVLHGRADEVGERRAQSAAPRGSCCSCGGLRPGGGRAGGTRRRGRPRAPPWTLGGSLLVQPLGAYAALVFPTAPRRRSGLLSSLRAGSGRARAEASLEAAVLTGVIGTACVGRGGNAVSAGRTSFCCPHPPSAATRPLLPACAPCTPRWTWTGCPSRLGRQVVNYGRGTLWSPTDIFTELDLSGISPVRRGTDAAAGDGSAWRNRRGGRRCRADASHRRRPLLRAGQRPRRVTWTPRSWPPGTARAGQIRRYVGGLAVRRGFQDRPRGRADG